MFLPAILMQESKSKPTNFETYEETIRVSFSFDCLSQQINLENFRARLTMQNKPIRFCSCQLNLIFQSPTINFPVLLVKEAVMSFQKYHSVLIGIGILTVVSLITVGVLAERGMISGKNASSKSPSASANPLTAQPLPSATPQLSKEFIYAGSRLLATEDANAPHSSNQPSDLVVWRKSNGAWYVRDSGEGGQMSSGVFGQDGDKPVPADFDGDGLYDFCVYRPSNGTWYILPNNGGTSFYGVQFGLSSDEPVPADYDGDGRADIALWRNSAATFYILQSSTNTVQSTAVGQAGDKPIPADYDGDGRADAAVYRLGATINWYIKQSSLNYAERIEAYGNSGDEPVRGDFDGDGRFDPAVRRNAPANLWLYQSSQSGTSQTIVFSASVQMQATDKSVTGDYDGDGRTDAAVYRDGATGTDPSYWYIRKSSDGSLRTEQWGQHQDVPVPAPFRR